MAGVNLHESGWDRNTFGIHQDRTRRDRNAAGGKITEYAYALRSAGSTAKIGWSKLRFIWLRSKHEWNNW